jgi:endonuclease/exonuclease/phosphatase family metal-dependent hydrolase
MLVIRHPAVVATLVVLAGCRTGQNYPDRESPRYAGGAIAQPPERTSPDTLRLVTFNIKYALNVDSAISVLTSEPPLRGADVILLQEMDEAGTHRIADALGLQYVYYPAIFRSLTKRDFGNAILSRWPIVEDAKIVLPHMGWFVGTQRTATAATILVGDTPVRVYSAHLGTFVNVGPGQRRHQLGAILADAARYPRVIIGGDMNDTAGYAWPTARGPRTATVGRLDHLFLRGLAIPDSAASGTVLDVRDASDHRPVWAKAIIE